MQSLTSLDAEAAQRCREQGAGEAAALPRAHHPGAAGAKVTVGPVDVEAAHPAFALRGAEAFVAFHTERYKEYPMVVRGAGAAGR